MFLLPGTLVVGKIFSASVDTGVVPDKLALAKGRRVDGLASPAEAVWTNLDTLDQQSGNPA